MATEITIAGRVFLPNGGGPKGGTITISLPANTKDGSGNKILGRAMLQVPDGGLLTGVGLKILATQDLTPANTYYDVEYALVDSDGNVHPKNEQWDVATTPTTQNIGDLAV